MRRPDSYIGGIDVCSEDGDILWDHIKNASTQFVMIKATEGADEESPLPCLNDPKFSANVRDAYLHGLRVGAYHCLSVQSVEATKKQILCFLKQVESMGHMINFYCGIVVTEWGDIDDISLYLDICAGLVSIAGYIPIIYIPIELAEKIDCTQYNLWFPYAGKNLDSISKSVRKKVVLWQHKPISIRGVKGEVFRSALIQPEVLFDCQFNSKPIIYSSCKASRPDKHFIEAIEWAIHNGILCYDSETNYKEAFCREELMILLRRFSDLWRAVYV